ncbi:hypothetical protein C943_03875 [Mariniradius saccharolyticus AK6]|jgi:hypothetical protein|uniref:Uncharacterized protein n=1 Tax=Mariniradius saccharolyticus AK6 TaxID=1239962 RepID=M7XGU5_9BACT|nr:hypothetical protein [Mariniradius saccharolyticus]EMS34059.1 hypothetical protein C943_03875 [Mariniradius saccharolyticus AK6]
METGELTLLLGGLVTFLLSVIAYFLRLLVQDIRDLKREHMDLRELCIWLKAEQGQLKMYLEGGRRRASQDPGIRSNLKTDPL